MSARDLYADLGIDLPARGDKNVQLRCFAAPDAHRRDDHRPSCSVHLETGVFNCFGCGAKGGPYDAALARGRSRADAMELLRRHGLAGERDDRPAPSPHKPKAAPPPGADLNRYRQALETNAGALASLEELRGWTADAIRALGLGLDGERIIFPVRSSDGALANLLRYAPDPERRTSRRKMLAGKDCRRDLFPAPETLEGDEAWIVEGEPDAVAGHSLGLPAVAVPGIRGWRAEWAGRFAGRRIVVCLDCDCQGREAAQRIARDLLDYAAEVRVLDLNPKRDDGYDLGDLALEGGRDGEAGRVDLRRVLDRMATQVPPLEPENGAGLLTDLAAFVRRFVVVSQAQAAVIALWIVHTHALDAAEETPYLGVTSAEKRSGKTRLLELLELLVRAPLRTTNISDAALFRSIAQDHPTLLFDEIDAIFGSKARDREDLRGMVNGGHRRGAEVRRVGGANRDNLERFPVFCPKALAGIGTLPETVADRSLPLRLERKAPGEGVERFRRRAVQPEATVLRERVERFAAGSIGLLGAARPDLPAALDDRAQDGAEPLLAIADSAGIEWGERARQAIVELRGGERFDEDSIGVRLLTDVREAFEARGDDRVATADLLECLHALDDAPWTEWYGKPLTAQGLSKLLKPYRVRSRTVRLDDGGTAKGYKREQFDDAWKRYLPANPASVRHNVTTRMGSGIAPDSYASQDRVVTVAEEVENPHGERDVTDVTDREAGDRAARPIMADENVIPFAGRRGVERPATAEEDAEAERLRAKFGDAP